MAMVQRRPIGEQHTAAVRCDEPSVRRVVDVVSHTIRTYAQRERERENKKQITMVSIVLQRSRQRTGNSAGNT